ncbi:ATP-dependent DNA helicase [Actinotalea ferrariae]|uniref:ATP-dependent DNA helicase n=1 Tax=Actinotalea ferrariae TaxID=1386098 RepID=UPI0027DF956F|nr:AAA family ATPase [Actinotalea ferrariae]
MARRSTWTRWNVHAEVARTTRALTMATPADRLALLDRVTDAVLASCLSVEAPAILSVTGRYARPDGTSVFDRVGEEAHTHPAVLAAEARLLAATQDITAPRAAAASGIPIAAGAGVPRLAADQAHAVRAVATSGRRVDVLVGPAGSGKTTTVLSLRRLWEQTHGRGSVLGLAPSSSAAAQLATALGITCENTAKWLHESSGPAASTRAALLADLHTIRATALTEGDQARARTADSAIRTLSAQVDSWTMREGQLVIVDEASLASTASLDAVVAQAVSAGAKVLLVGDGAQLSAVDAGGAFALLAERCGPARLTSLWRFIHPWEAEATMALRRGNPRVLEEYADHGRIHDGPSEAMLEDAYTAWTSDTERGITSVLIAPDAASVAALNARAHRDRVTDGLVAPDGITTRAGAQIGVGDRVVTRANARRLRTEAGGWVRNGDLWNVTAVHADAALTLTRTSAHAERPGAPTRVRVPPDYAADHVEHGYATTTHRAQGITTTTAHVLAHAGMTRENLYVAMTRGRAANHLYVAIDAIDPDCDALPDVHAPTDAHQLLTDILTTPGAQQSATATIAARQDQVESLRRLEPIRRTLLADTAHTRWATALIDAGLDPQAARAAMTSPNAGALVVALGRIDTVTGDVAPVLRQLVAAASDEPGLDHAVRLRFAAMDWLDRHMPDPHDIHPDTSTHGMDDDGRALLTQVDDAIAARIAALTGQVLTDRPTWLAALGPEPSGPEARTAWLDAVAATAVRLDRSPAPATTPTLATTPPPVAVR